MVQGLMVALDHLDDVIELIRHADSAEAALTQLQQRFELSEVQARAILDMQLRRLAALERQRILDEYEELTQRIADLRHTLDTPQRVRQIIVDELSDIRERYDNPRRTRILPGGGDLDMEDLIPEEEIVVTLTRAGYIKRVRVDEYRTQRRGGRGVAGAGLKEDDIVRDLFVTTTHSWLLVFTNQGRVYRVRAWQVPEKSRTARGTYIANVEGLALAPEERVAAVVDVADLSADDDRHLVFATKRGLVKRTPLSAYDSPRNVLIAVKLREDDELIGVQITSGDGELLLISRRAMAIRFAERDARPTGRDTYGVTGMALSDDDALLTMTKSMAEGQVLAVTDAGYGKRTPLEHYPAQRRGGKGVLTAKLDEARGELVGALVMRYDQELFVITDTGTIIRMDVADIRPTGRATQGVRVMRPDDSARVVAIAPVLDRPTETDEA
ncbi:MAG: hypothetical protein BRC31_01720 [Actinobacteria bacterium QS_5_72_10]|nr:MAG: hypothetical protein BRC31_01720 [Actinobacteria bacterium QS_5_72_10]